MRYKKCLLPGCKNNSYNSSKIFIRITTKIAPKWCSSLGIAFNPQTEYYCCEEHVKLEDAVQNYSIWRSKGGPPKINKKFDPNFYLIKENIPTLTQSHQPKEVHPVQKGPILRELLLREQEPPNATPSDIANSPFVSPIPQKTFIPKKVQVGIQCKPEFINKGTNYRCRTVTKLENALIKPSNEHSSPIITDYESDDVAVPSMYGSTSEIEEFVFTSSSNNQLRNDILSLIEKYPKMYIGVPKSFYWIINYISSQNNIDRLKIIMVLYKIKQNDTNSKICHLFQTNKSHMKRIFPSTIEILSNFFQNLIFLPDTTIIKKNLPLAFKIRFSNVQCILDCFEIEIEKPSDPVSQSQTWSQYKGCNTAKYLVGCTPDGFVCFISKGYGGRCSDKMIVETSDLLDILPENCVILADRGFKAVEASLAIKNIRLLRPPSVYSGLKPEKSEVLRTKVIASLRVHVERLIRRLREFRFLKPHAVVKHQHMVYLDQIVIIACGLINLQNKLIKDK